MRDIMILAVAGALGTLSRYGVSRSTHALFGDHFPFGTLMVNVLGCLILGFIMPWLLAHDQIPKHMQMGLTFGFLGAFTTFSAFGYDTVRLFQDGAWTASAVNLLANLILGFMAIVAGFLLQRAVFTA